MLRGEHIFERKRTDLITMVNGYCQLESLLVSATNLSGLTVLCFLLLYSLNGNVRVQFHSHIVVHNVRISSWFSFLFRGAVYGSFSLLDFLSGAATTAPVSVHATVTCNACVVFGIVAITAVTVVEMISDVEGVVVGFRDFVDKLVVAAMITVIAVVVRRCICAMPSVVMKCDVFAAHQDVATVCAAIPAARPAAAERQSVRSGAQRIAPLCRGIARSHGGASGGSCQSPVVERIEDLVIYPERAVIDRRNDVRVNSSGSVRPRC